ncbi:MAG: ABC-F family ATP-binding cassette domain-containing protein [Candidatus Riflebacteria bacterium]|nr:ABC-F family ATP-binding cassette domain-containing protein [Candidatus Riflebacteria bacterium]
MAILVSCQSVSASYGSRSLFTDLSIALSDGDRVGMIGPNGAGKSTLLRVLAGLEEPDSGVRSVRSLTRVAYVPQVPRFTASATAREVVRRSLEHEIACSEPTADEAERSTRVAEALNRVGFVDVEAVVETLSGGWKRRLSLACELVKRPDVLLLDEPTNHLDLDGVLWLERLLGSAPFAFLVVTHDRIFLENVTTRVVELNSAYPGGCFGVAGNYSEFLVRREEHRVAQARHQESLTNKVRREVEWLRRGPKARTGKSRSRIDAAGRLIEELSDMKVRGATGRAGVEFDGSNRRTRQLLVAEGIGKQMGGRRLFSGLDLSLSPGDRLGVLGANGSGKTTLLRVLGGELAPDEGTIRTADLLQVVTFDQSREQLDLGLTLRSALTPAGGDSVVYRDRMVHVVAWARRFLFRPEQLDVTLSMLSGGEQSRVLIARLMLRRGDLLILDEPTNDLDLDTLEVLEESLTEFPGALVLVTHDRYLLDRVSTSLVGLDGHGRAELFADYSQWEEAERARASEAVEASRQARSRRDPGRKPSRSLSYNEKRELETIDDRIVEAEQLVATLERRIDEPEVACDAVRLGQLYRELTDARTDVERLYARWAELEQKRA